MSTRYIPIADIEKAVQQLQGRIVLHSQLENDTIHIFTLQFGPVSAANQIPEEFLLMVHCAWRTVEAGSILCTWQESIEGYAIPALKALEGLQVANVTLSEFGDLSIHFATGRTLHIWNDAPYEDGDSWVLRSLDLGDYAVSTRNEFTHRQSAG